MNISAESTHNPSITDVYDKVSNDPEIQCMNVCFEAVKRHILIGPGSKNVANNAEHFHIAKRVSNWLGQRVDEFS